MNMSKRMQNPKQIERLFNWIPIPPYESLPLVLWKISVNPWRFDVLKSFFFAQCLFFWNEALNVHHCQTRKQKKWNHKADKNAFFQPRRWWNLNIPPPSSIRVFSAENKGFSDEWGWNCLIQKFSSSCNSLKRSIPFVKSKNILGIVNRLHVVGAFFPGGLVPVLQSYSLVGLLLLHRFTNVLD